MHYHPRCPRYRPSLLTDPSYLDGILGTDTSRPLRLGAKLATLLASDWVKIRAFDSDVIFNVHYHIIITIVVIRPAQSEQDVGRYIHSMVHVGHLNSPDRT